jgi:hypothetical protein
VSLFNGGDGAGTARPLTACQNIIYTPILFPGILSSFRISIVGPSLTIYKREKVFVWSAPNISSASAPSTLILLLRMSLIFVFNFSFLFLSFLLVVALDLTSCQTFLFGVQIMHWPCLRREGY